MAAPQQPTKVSRTSLAGRTDFTIIGQIIEPRSKVLDLGCGEGELLAWLVENKSVIARGVEIEPVRVRKAIARGLSAYQGDINEGLADYPDEAFDYVILSQTLQETLDPRRILSEMMRVGKRAIISFPNFGHWSVRLSMLRSGQAPKTRLFPYDWYDSPNIHFVTVRDFEALAVKQGFRIERRYFVSGTHQVSIMPNLMAEVAVYLLQRQDRPEGHTE
jgi:methionine biosynthesis protein MetW